MNNHHWATPNARDTHNPSEPDSDRTKRRLAQGWTIDLNEQAAWFNVADAQGSVGGGQSKRMTEGGGLRKLEDQIEGELWMTPNVPNGGRVLSEEDVLAKGSTANGKRQVGLEMQTRFFPTPAARDYRSESGGGKNDEPLQSPIGAESPGDDRARPIFPPGPSDREGWATVLRETPWLAPAISEEEAQSLLRREPDGLSPELDFGNRTDRLRALGNAVCPLQGAFAFITLARRAGLK